MAQKLVFKYQDFLQFMDPMEDQICQYLDLFIGFIQEQKFYFTGMEIKKDHLHI